MPNDTMLGHNSQQELPPALDPVILSDQLAIDYAKDVERTAELMAGFDRFQQAHPEITDEETNGRAADFVKQLAAAAKEINGRREGAKRPYMVATDTVHNFFKKGMIDPLEKAADTVKRVMTKYQVAKREREQREAAERARIQREEAERLAREAEATAKPEKFDAAIAADNAARIEERRAAAPSAELSRTRGEYGSVASLRRTWAYRVIDITQLPPHLLTVNDGMVKAHMRSTKDENGKPQAVPGIEFYEVETTQVR